MSIDHQSWGSTFTGDHIAMFQFEAVRGGWKIGKFKLADYLRTGNSLFRKGVISQDQATLLITDLATANNRSKAVKELKRDNQDLINLYYDLKGE